MSQVAFSIVLVGFVLLEVFIVAAAGVRSGLIISLATGGILLFFMLVERRDLLEDAKMWYLNEGYDKELRGCVYMDIATIFADDDFLVVLSPDGFLYAKRGCFAVRLRVENCGQAKPRRPNWRVVETLVKMGVRYVPPEGVLQ